MELHVLGSGSKGNCAIVESGDSAVMVDCGLTRKAVRERMAILGLDPSRICALLVTHEHTDHVKGIEVNLRGLGVEGELPIYCTKGTRSNVKYLSEYGNVVEIRAGDGFDVGGIHVDVFDTSHDVAEPVGFRFSTARNGDIHDASTIGYMTDSGICTPMGLEMLSGCQILAIETNHDPAMLRNGPYPAYLKKRIASDRGHLSNDGAGALLPELASDGLGYVVGMHISQENNDPDIPRRLLETELEQIGLGSAKVDIARQNTPRSISL